MVQNYLQNRYVFRCLQNAAKESVFLIVVARAFQNFGAVGKSSETKLFSGVFFSSTWNP